MKEANVLLLDYTWNLVLRGFCQYIQFLLVVLPQVCPLFMALCLLVRYCAAFITRI